MTAYLAFPFSIRSGEAATVDLAEHVRQVIALILFTEPGERVNRPDFGAGVDRLVFEPTDQALAIAVKHLVQASLQRNAGGLFKLRSLDVVADGARLSVTVDYIDLATNLPQSLTLEHAK